MEQQRAEAGEQERGLDAQRQPVALHQDGDKDGRAEHGEQVLQTQQQHPRNAQRSRVVDGIMSEFFLHDIFLSFVTYYKIYLPTHSASGCFCPKKKTDEKTSVKWKQYPQRGTDTPSWT